ncbi:mycofactocin biosynthesis peptidyl-dipeptidase MftE [Herbiconiux sp. 11R-BC]|uniref:mycofactocin biosynthesis peptidyl-dipeptidase MftE n=1 Tax=Herbiconiux sp. 11R-BC TaxID=3111637 RepID=UPI003C10B337
MATELSRHSWPAVPLHPLVLVPLGSTEQHGPHLPFTTDTVIASAVAAGVAARFAAGREAPGAAGAEGRVAPPAAGVVGSRGSPGTSAVGAEPAVVVAPALGFGASGEHQSFAGTVSIGQEALRFVLIELVRSLSTWAERVVFVNGHGGNVAALSSAVAQLVAEQHRVGWLPCSAPAEALAAAGLPAPDAHAGRTETSLMLHLAPGTVRLPLPPAGATAPLSSLLPRLTAGGVAAVSPSGILGDPTGANAAEGGRLLAAVVDEAVRLVVAGEPDARGMLRVPGRPPVSPEPTSAGEPV